MTKIAFMGAGSTVFAKNVLGDCLVTPSLTDCQISLYDIDGTRLKESKKMLDTLNKNYNKGKAKITTHLGVKNRKAALRNANFVVNAIQIGGYEPSTVIDFEIPKKYGLRQTIADTIGIGGIFRALRTIPVMFDFAKDMESVCPDALMLNYTNPMPALSTAMLRGTNIKYVGLCHSVQDGLGSLLRTLDIKKDTKKLKCRIAGINHMAWLLDVSENGKDLYPEIKKIARKKIAQWRKAKDPEKKSKNMTRIECMLRFGHYITESSEHFAEYVPYFIKTTHPELIEEYKIPLDEYPRRCVNQINNWKKRSKELVHNKNLEHERSLEYGSRIINAMVTNDPWEIGGSVLNTGLITNLPQNCAVEVPCLVNRNGIQPTYIGDLPEACAALNRTYINPALLAVEAALTKKKEHIYQAAMLDPHTGSELSIDQIVSLCDDLIKAHGKMLPRFK